MTTQLLGCQTHIQDNYLIYSELQMLDKMFLTKVLYIIARCIQNFFKYAQQGKFVPECLDFTSMFNDVVQNRSFNARLPQFIIARKRKHENTNEANNNQNGRPKRDDKGVWVRNTRVNPVWKQKDGEEYGKMFHPHCEHLPKREGLQLCGKFHIQGWCYTNYKYDHNDVDRNSLSNKMNTFCQRCRSAIF